MNEVKTPEEKLLEAIFGKNMKNKDEVLDRYRKDQAKKTSKEEYETLDKLFNHININDLFNFLKEYGAKHPGFKKELNTWLKKECLAPDNTKAFDLRQDVLNAFDESIIEGRYGEWLNLHELHVNLDDVFNSAEDLMEMGNPEPALAAGVQALETLGESFVDYQPDDSHGYGSSIFRTANELIMTAAKHPRMSREVLEEYVDEIEKDKDIDELHEYGFESKGELLMQLAPLTKTPEEILKMLNRFIKSCKSEYDLSELVKKKIETLNVMRRESERQKTIQKYLELPKIRAIAVDDAVSIKDYDKALSLIEDGIALAKSVGYYGTERDWMKRRAEVYEAMGDKDNLIATTRELLIKDHFSKEYYLKLKTLIPKEQWKTFLFETIDQNPLDGRYGIDAIAAIYIEEKEWERLFALVVNGKHTHIYDLDSYAKYLKGKHSEEILHIYDDKLRWEAAQGTGRDRYESIAHSMRVMQSLAGGQAAAHTLAEFFRQTYRNRRAMMEIISEF